METADDEALCFMVGANMLTIYPDSKLYEEIQRGNWQEESEP